VIADRTIRASTGRNQHTNMLHAITRTRSGKVKRQIDLQRDLAPQAVCGDLGVHFGAFDSFCA
jgi:hypothetical protein